MSLTVVGNRVVLPWNRGFVVSPRMLAAAMMVPPAAVGTLDWPYGMPGTYQPDSTTSGLPGGLIPDDLDLYTGPLTITTPTTLEGYRFEDLVIDNAGCSFGTCAFVGPANAPSTDKGLLASSSINTTVKDSLFKPRAPGEHLNGIRSAVGMTVLRCDISNVVDGIDVLNGTFTIKANYIHDFSYYSPSSTHSDNQTHNDGIAISGGTKHVIVGNNIQAFADMSISTNGAGLLGPQGQVNTAIIITPDVALMTDMQINDNYLDGGQYSINAANGSAGTLGDLGEILRNKFGRLQAKQGTGGDATYTLVLTKSATCDTGDGTADQNTYADNGHAITVRRTN